MIAIPVLGRPFALLLVLMALGVPNLQARDLSIRDLQPELDRVAARGGGVVRFERSETVVVEGGIVLPNGVTLDLNGGHLITRLDGPHVAGVRMLSNTTLRGGTIQVRSRGQPGEQTGYHAAVLVGALYGENGDASRPSRFEAPVNWRIEGITATSDKWLERKDGPIGAAAIQIVGGARRGTIERVTIPDSHRMAGGIMLDWGAVGAVSSHDIPASQKLHRSKQGYTSHPNAITIRNVDIGRLTAGLHGGSGTFGVRLSGVHDIAVSHVWIAETTEAAVLHHAGDLGYRFAQASDRLRAHRGISIVDVRAHVSQGYGFRSDTEADNLTRAFGSPQIAPSDLSVTDFHASATAGRGAVGLRLDRHRGGSFSNLSFTDFATAVVIDEQVHGVTVQGVAARGSTRRAFTIGHPRRMPSNITLQDVRAYGDNAAARTGLVTRSLGVRLAALTGIDLIVDEDAREFQLD